VRSCTISYDIWPPRYRTLDESAIDIAISCNRYDHYIEADLINNIDLDFECIVSQFAKLNLEKICHD